MNLKNITLISGILLLIAVPNWLPYGFYTLLRWLICISAIFTATQLKNQKGDKLQLFFWGLAILFNPVAPIYLNKSLWVLIDLASSFVFFYTYSKTKEKLAK